MRKRLTIIVILLLLLLGTGGQVLLSCHRPGPASSVDEGVVVALGGFRSIAAEVVWWRADRLYREGRFGELMQLSTMLTYLQPHDAEVWAYAAWNLAYNVSVRMPRLEDRWKWVYEAITLLRDKGLAWNPGDPDICRELAQFFETKIGLDAFDEASRLYQIEWARLVRATAEKGTWQQDLGMDPERMARVERAFGVTDWTNPQASALYWASYGLETANDRQRLSLEILIRQSRKMLLRSQQEAEART